MDRLKGKVCIVTGGGSGIGLAICEAFAKEGAQVVVADIDDQKGPKVALALGPKASFARLDVTKEDQWQAVLDHTVTTLGSVDVLVNNAGVTGTGKVPHDPENTDLAEWQRVLHINLDSVFLGCKHAIKTMRLTGRSGSIINMSSRSGLVGIPHAAAYAASKAAIRNHSKTVALYCAEQNLPIRCNTIFPASIRTPMWEAMMHGQEEEQALLDSMPLHRFGRPEEVAAIAVLLASDEATYVTGSEFNIDGGILAGTSTSPK
jgi:3(or 17)beta-hydroxysteroid dehydrogenase